MPVSVSFRYSACGSVVGEPCCWFAADRTAVAVGCDVGCGWLGLV